MTDTQNLRVIIEEKSTLIDLKVADNLSEIRKELEKNSIIKTDDTLLFSDSDFYMIMRNCESKYCLKGVIKDNYPLYLINCKRIDHFISDSKLEFGRTLAPNSNKIEIAEHKAFTINKISPIKPDVIIEDGQVNFNSKNSWEKERDKFLNAEADLINFLSLRSNQQNQQEIKEKFPYNFTKFPKIYLKFDGIKPTQEFIKEVEKALNSKNKREELRNINKKFGQFVPNKVTLGGIYCYVDEFNKSRSDRLITVGGELQDPENFNKEKWVNSLDNYKTWN